jgi:hypothetical protein
MAQQLSALPVHPAHPIEGGKVCQLVGPPLSCMQQTEVQMRLRAIGIHQLGCNQFVKCSAESALLLRGHRPRIVSRQCAGGLDANGAHRVGKQPTDHLNKPRLATDTTIRQRDFELALSMAYRTRTPTVGHPRYRHGVEIREASQLITGRRICPLWQAKPRTTRAPP